MGISEVQARRLYDGAKVYGHEGVLLGRLGQVYVDRDSATPVWATLTPPDSPLPRFVPLDHARLDGVHLVLPYTLDQLAACPHPHMGEPPSAAQEDDLYRHYQLRD